MVDESAAVGTQATQQGGSMIAHTEVTPTKRVLESDFDDETKLIFLGALMSSPCRDCAREAHKALHRLDGARCGG